MMVSMVSACARTNLSASLANAKLAEYLSEQIIRGEGAGDF
jgi:hypothetical protein